MAKIDSLKRGNIGENAYEPVRYWEDRNIALLELGAEGWILIGPFY